MNVIYLGDIRLIVALAGAVTALLLAASAYRASAYWALTIIGVLGAVAANKILFMGWGISVDAWRYKAASGHAAGAAAVLPIALYLLGSPYGRRTQALALLTGWLLSIGVAVSLVRHDEHTIAEAVFGWCLGLTASAWMWRILLRSSFKLTSRHIRVVIATLFLVGVCMQEARVGWWMTKTALLLSGERRTHSWNKN